MLVADGKKIDFNMMSGEGIKGAGMKKLIGPENGWEGYVMREVNLTSFGN